MTRLFGTQGFRGIVNKELTSTVAQNIGLAVARYLGQQKTIGIGWDTRQSSEMIGFAFTAGLMAGGCDAHILGLVPTPLLSYAIPQLKLDGGVMITASHNPPEYNGIKLWGKDGASFSPEMERTIEKQYFAEAPPEIHWQNCGRLSPAEDFRLQYIEGLLDQIDSQRLITHQFNLAADCGGGAATMVAPALLNAIGAQTRELFCDPDGLFTNRLPEPTEKNLTKLIHTVKEDQLDLGMAWDGDADRIIFITEKGRYLTGDRVFALAAYHMLRDLQEKPKQIVTQVATSDVIFDVAAAVDAEVIETRVGEPYIVAKMKESNAVIGGEENGGVVYRGWSWTREGFLTAIMILELMAIEGKSLEELDRQFPSYFQVKDRIPCSPQLKGKLLQQISKITPTDADCSDIDGVKLRYSDGWVLLRPSGTEPVFRIFTEAKTKTRAKNLLKQAYKIVDEAQRELQSD
ncbi:MAG: phosphoglucosamine mutase [Candidatus Thorarchaeota archaeon]